MFGSGERQAQEELRLTQMELRSAQEELRSFKQRMGKDLPMSRKAGHTENMNNPVNKSRLQEMYHHLRVNELPKVTNQLADKGEDPQMFQELIQGTFQEAVSTTSRLFESMNQTLRGKRSKKEHPLKVQEYINSSMQSLQMAFFHCNKKDLHCAAVRKATEVSRELVSECYWLGCLMALNDPPVQPNLNNHRPKMDHWNILPREITHITQELISKRRMHNPDDGLAQSGGSVSSDRSIEWPLDFRNPSIHNSSTAEQEEKAGKTQQSSNYSNATFQRVEEDILKSVREQMQWFDRLQTSNHRHSTLEPLQRTSEREQEAVLNITLDFLRRIDEPLANLLQKETAVPVCCNNLKSHLLKKFSHVSKGLAKAGSSTSLQQIYTELYITEGGVSEVNEDHEVRHIETSRRLAERTITSEDIFKQSEQPIRTVLTVGVAGVGKTVLTQKFSLDWAEGRVHQDVHLLLPFTFRELNVLRDTEFSLVGLVHHCFSQTKGLSSLKHLKALLIFDGLDECRFPLDFSRTRVLTEPTESASVEELLVNLIRGRLLPSARLWITTRPAAANQIPAECVSMVTEVRGFSDLQKEQYFRNRFRDEEQATKVISHIKSIRSLYIMSYIPIFSWILSTVLENMMKATTTDHLPTTITQMYMHFLVVQAKVKNIKYHEGTGADLHWTEENKEMVRSLGKLAYEQLKKGNLIFYESDLSECGLDAAEIARYSGVFTQVFREEQDLYQNKVYCFIHLSVQEFLAAFHVHQTFFSSGKNLLSTQHSTESPEAFYYSAVDQALESPNGNLDLFLRFLLGLSLPTNQSLLKGLMTQTEHDSTNQETVKYIKEKLNEKGFSAERSLNLLHCLNELNDHSLLEEIQKVMRGGGYDKYMSSAHWSALAFLLLSSDSILEEFDLNKYNPSDEALQKLLLVVKASKNANLSCCNLSQRSCGPLASALSSSSLTYLDLSNNDLWDSGVELLCEGLKSGPQRLETLRLSGCLVSEEGTASLATALSSASFHLKELDLSYNHPGSSSKRLAALLAQPHRLIDSLNLKPAGMKWLVPGLNKYYCKLSLDSNTANAKLKLSDNNRTVTFMEEDQLYPNHQHRFDSCPQVLSSTALNGRYYWEVGYDLRENGSVSLALSYIGITTKEDGKKSEFGANKESWALKISRESFSVSHDGAESKLSYTPHQIYDSCYHSRVAVYLDYTGGSLSFYEIKEGRKTLLHTYHASFTQPLFAGFTVHSGSVSLVENDQ